MEVLRLTEIEAIQLTIKYEFDGSELVSAKFKKNGSLDGQRDKITGEFLNSGMKTFLNKLKQIYEHVEVEGKGKRKIYILSGLKSNIQVINDFRSIAQQDDDDLLLAKHLYNSLFHWNKGYPLTLNKWTIEIGGLNPKLIKKELIHELFDELYYGADLSNIHHSVTEYIKQRNEKVASKSIRILKQKGLIDIFEVYQAITTNTEYITIDKETYEDWQNQFKEIIHKHGYKTKNYKFHIHKEENKEFKEEIEAFQKESGIKTVYIAYNIQIKRHHQPFDVSYIDFQATYNDKMIKLISQFPECKREHQNFFSARFKKFNYLSVLKACNWTIQIDNELIMEFEPNPFVIESMINDRKNHKGMEKVVERLRKSNDSFGELLEGNITLDEFKNGVTESDNKIDVPEQDSKPTYTLDELLSDVQIPHYTYIPFDLSNTKQDTYKDTIHNNKALKDAVKNIRFAFQSQLPEIG